MPGKEHNRKIVSKAQQRFLFAAADRGEISKTKVEHMAKATEKSKGSLKNLPNRIKKKSSVNSVDMSLRRAIASGDFLTKSASNKYDTDAVYNKAAGFFGDAWKWLKGSPSGSSNLTGPSGPAQSQLDAMDQ